MISGSQSQRADRFRSGGSKIDLDAGAGLVVDSRDGPSPVLHSWEASEWGTLFPDHRLVGRRREMWRSRLTQEPGRRCGRRHLTARQGHMTG